MFSNSFQSGFISIFYSVGTTPLAIWDKQVKNGHIRRVIDEEVKSLVLEVSGTNVATTYITCPIKPRASLGIKLPFLVMIIKNMNKYFTFEIQILDDKDMHRRFRVSNFQSTTKVRPFCTTMPIGLSKGWNQVQFNLADFTKRAYGSTYLETQRVQIHANVRIRRIYFADQLYSEEDLPNEFKLFVPTGSQKKESKTKLEPKGKRSGSLQKVSAVQVSPGAVPTPADLTPRIHEGEEAGAARTKSVEEAPAILEDIGVRSEAEPSIQVSELPGESVEIKLGEGGEEHIPAEAEGGEQAAEGVEPEAEGVEPAEEGAGEGAGEVEGGEVTEGGEAAAEDIAEAAPPEEATAAAGEGGAEIAEDEVPPPSEGGGEEAPTDYTEPTTEATEDLTATEGATTDEGETTEAPTESGAEDSPEE